MKPNAKELNMKYGKYCGMIRKRDFEDEHPIICSVIFCGVAVLFIWCMIIM